MTSRERVKFAFYRVKADRIPINYSGNININNELCRHFNTDYEGMLRALNVDFRIIYVPYKGKLLFKEIEGRNVNPVYGYYTRWVEHKSGGYFDFTNFPLKEADDETIANFPLPDPNDFDYDNVDALIKNYDDLSLHVGTAGTADIINSTGRIMGMEQILVNLITEHEATLTYINRKVNFELAVLEKTIERAKGRVDFLWMGEDLGTQIAPIISPELYRKILKPIHKRYVDLAKSYNLPVMFHSCGSSSWAFEDFIEIGIDAVDTLQPEAANMQPRTLVDKFSGRLSFHGCISTAGPLAYGTAQQVEETVRETIEIMKPTFSYMCAPSHQIQDNTPLENVLAMYQTALKYGRYD